MASSSSDCKRSAMLLPYSSVQQNNFTDINNDPGYIAQIKNKNKLYIHDG